MKALSIKLLCSLKAECVYNLGLSPQVIHI